MASTVTYAFYQDTYGGGLSEAAFAASLPLADSHVRWLCAVRGARTTCNAFKRAVCAAVDAFAEFGTGEVLSADEIFARIKKNPLCRGVTFSGGDPVYQAKEFAELARLLKAAGYEVALYTGFSWEELLAEKNAERLSLLRLADIVVDGRFEIEKRTLELKFRGSANQRIIESAKSMARYDQTGDASPILCTQKRWVG